MSGRSPLELLADQKIISASAQFEFQLEARGGSRPALAILAYLKHDAAKALAKMVVCNLFTKEGREECLTLQNKVKRYLEWFAAAGALLEEGKQLDQEMADDERQEIFDLLQRSPDGNRELMELGLVDPPPD